MSQNINLLQYFTKCYKLIPNKTFWRKRAIVGVWLCCSKRLLVFPGKVNYTTDNSSWMANQLSLRHSARLCHLASLHHFQAAFAWQSSFLCVQLIQKPTSNPTKQAGALGDVFALKKGGSGMISFSQVLKKLCGIMEFFFVFNLLFDKSWGKRVGNGNAAKNMKWAVTILSASLLLANLRRPTS